MENNKKEQELVQVVDLVSDIIEGLFGAKVNYDNIMKDTTRDKSKLETDTNKSNGTLYNSKTGKEIGKGTIDISKDISKKDNKIYGDTGESESLLGKYVPDEKIDTNEPKQETLADKIEKEKNHIGGKCKVIKHQFIKEGTELIIKDVLPTTAQVMCCTNVGDILYLNVEDIEIIEDKKEEEWKDIEYHWNNNHTVYITKNKIQYFGEINNFTIMELKFSDKDIKLISKLYKQNITEFKRLIMMKANYQIKDKKYNKLDKEIDEKMDKLEKMGYQCDSMQEEIKNILNIVE